MNAKYAISIARKLGAIIFLIWEDIPNLNKKMLLIFVCSLYDLKQTSTQGTQVGEKKTSGGTKMMSALGVRMKALIEAKMRAAREAA